MSRGKGGGRGAAAKSTHTANVKKCDAAAATAKPTNQPTTARTKKNNKQNYHFNALEISTHAKI
jgi:hypothetical protein